MKKIYFATFLIFTFAISVHAQDKANTGTEFEKQNILKLNLTSLGLGNFYLQDEYTLSSHSSVALGLSYLPTRGLPTVLVNADSIGNISALRFSGYSITPEFRFYVSGHAPNGFYLAPYIRHSSYTIHGFDFAFDQEGGGTGHVNVSGNYKSTTFGLLLGSQWKLGNHVTLDWWIFGAGFGSTDLSLAGTGNFSPQDQSDITRQVSTIDLPVGTLKSQVDANNVNVTFTSSLPGIRGGGLAIGYIF